MYVHTIFCTETMNSKAFLCPHCSTSDKYRMSALYVKEQYVRLDPAGVYTFLDIAPENAFRNFIKSYSFIDYRSMDLFMEDVDDKVDLTNMNCYSDGQFDFIMCSHVLEHIPDDRKAMSELYRVLSERGFAIIMVPILLNLQEDFEDWTKTSEEECWKYFGQNDHVRVYSKPGFTRKLQEAGFKLDQLGVDYFGQEVFEKYGIHPRSVLYVCRK